MNRKRFLKKGVAGVGSLISLPAILNACKNKKTTNPGNPMPPDGNRPPGPPPDGGRPPGPPPGGGGNPMDAEPWDGSGDCPVSPRETEGPFPIKSPAQLVRENIIIDRTGIPLLIKIIVKDNSRNCTPYPDVLVDIWQCDKDGEYSQYDKNVKATFLRGRQTTDANGEVSFISIFPGWYHGRAPHIHIEILDTHEKSLLVSQIAFPVPIYMEVYSSEGYHGEPDTSNKQDDIFANSLAGNMADSVTGNLKDGYTLLKTIIV